jgi:hypothetical protein
MLEIVFCPTSIEEYQSAVKGKDKVVPVLNYVIKHYTMKAYGGIEV